MTYTQLALALLACASSSSATAVTEKARCNDTQWTTYCPKICADGLGKAGWDYASCANLFTGTCWVHSIETRKDNGAPQGCYMQKCMQEYCTRGVCAGGGRSSGGWWSLLAKRHKVHRHGAGEKWWGAPMPGWGGGGNSYFRAPKGNDWPRYGCASSTYYCAELCHNLYHPVMTGIGDHPGTAGCSMYSCPTADQCNRDCNANWETKMKPIYDSYCACEKEIGAKRYPQGLLEAAAKELKPQHAPPEAADLEAVDVGAFMQTSMSSKAEEL